MTPDRTPAPTADGDFEPRTPAPTLDTEPSSGDAPPAAPPAGLPEKIGRYLIRAKLGEGTFGVVYRAFDPHLKRDVALKVAKPEQMATRERVQRFEREARSAAKLRHPCIVQVFETGTDGPHHFIAQGFVDGPSLDKVMDGRPNRRMEPAVAAGVVRKLAEALAYAHGRGLVHRDVKPSNALLEDGVPVLTDFGLVTEADDGEERLTKAGGKMMGTPAYMAPEQGEGNAIAASDQYSLGGAFYEMLTGETPFHGPEAIQLVLHASRPVKSPRKVAKSIPRDLETIVLKCVEKDPAKRYADCAALAEDLRRWEAGEPVTARRQGVIGKAWKAAKRNPATAVMLALLFATMSVAATVTTVFGLQASESLKAEKKALRESEAAAGKLKTSLRESKERLYLADLRLYAAKLRNASDEWERNNAAVAIQTLESCRWDLRGWEYRQLEQQFLQADRTLCGHSLTVTSVSFSPDGTRIATGSHDKTAKVWDARTGEELRTLRGHSEIVTSVSFSPDGSRIATGSVDQTAKVWDARTGEEVRTLRGHSDKVASVTFSPDGTRIATGSVDKTAKLWDARTGEEMRTLHGHTSPVLSVSFNPEGSRIVTGSWDKTAKVWDARTGEEVRTLREHSDGVTSVSFSHDGTRIITGSGDKTAKVWDGRTGEEVRTLRGHSGTVMSVSFSPDGTRIVTGSYDKTAKVWDARTGEEILNATDQPVGAAQQAVSPDGRSEAVADGNVVRPQDPTPTGAERDRADAAERREYFTRIAKFDPAWHAKMANAAEKAGDTFAAAFHLRLLTQHAPDHLGWHERYLAVRMKRDPTEMLHIIGRLYNDRLRESPPELLPEPHAPICPPPGPPAKILLRNPLPPNFDE